MFDHKVSPQNLQRHGIRTDLNSAELLKTGSHSDNKGTFKLKITLIQ